jgi:hypothetical protein
MQEIKIGDKQKYLNEHFPFEPVPLLSEKKYCMQCDLVFTVGDYKVFRDVAGDESICCPNAPECYGTAIDWLEIEG